jgi:hypothetical protein
MTVGYELARLAGYKLLHNHMTVEPVLDIFPFGSPPFDRLVSEFRRRIIEETVAADLPGLVFTMVWGLELTGDAETVASYAEIVESAGGRVSFVELYAELEERLERNHSDFRLAEKRSKRDLEFSHGSVLELEARHVMNTGFGRTEADPVLEPRDHLRIDNTHLSPSDVARSVASALAL